MFYNIDAVYQTPLARLTVGEEEALVPQLFLFVHFHLYFAVSCILRSHLSDALSSVRKAIDGGLTAYELILEPSKAEAYVNRDKFFQFIKANVQNAVTRDHTAYHLAHELLKIHDACSEFGSHADISSFFHRLETREEEDGRTGEVLMHYFQFPRKKEEYRFYFLVVLQAFFLIFRIFKVFFDDKLKIVDPTWESKIAGFGPELDRRRRAAYESFSSDA